MLGRSKKLRPARTFAEDAPVIADLDALIAEPILIRFQGTSHEIKPVDTATFLKTMSKFSSLLERSKKSGQSQDTKLEIEELVVAYGKVFSSVCDTIGEKQVREMTLSQIFALLQLIMDHVTGRTHTEKKKLKDLLG